MKTFEIYCNYGVLAAEKSNEYSPLASDVIAHIPQAITQLMRGQA